jgi:hypothetical protein
MATQWGRKETVIWPPQVPIYTIGAMILAVPILMTLLFGLYSMKPFLARNYTGDYLKSAAGSEFRMHNSFRLIYASPNRRTSFQARRSCQMAKKLAYNCRLPRPPRALPASPVEQNGRSRTRPSMDGSVRQSSGAMTFSVPTARLLSRQEWSLFSCSVSRCRGTSKGASG